MQGTAQDDLSGVWFNGTNSNGRIVGAFATVPLAQNRTLNRLALDFELDGTKLYLSSNNGDTANVVGAGLRKRRDALIAPPVPIG